MQQEWKDAYPGLLGKLITTVMLAVGRDVEQGSYSALYAATSPEIEEKGWNGYYFLRIPVNSERNPRKLLTPCWELPCGTSASASSTIKLVLML